MTSTVRHTISRSHIPPNAPGGIATLLVEGRSLSQIAVRYEKSKSTIYKWAMFLVDEKVLNKVGRASACRWLKGPNFDRSQGTPPSPQGTLPIRPHCHGPMQARVTGEWDETLMLKNGWKKTEGNKVTTWSVKAKDYNGEWSFAVKVGPRKAVAQCWPVGKTCQIDRLSFAAGRAAIKDFERRGISGLLHLQEYYRVPIELKPVKLEDIFVGSYLTDPEVIATLERYGYLQLGSGENKVLIDFSKDKDGLPYYTGPELEMGAIKFLKMMNAIDDWPEYAACQYRTEQHMKKVLDILRKQGEVPEGYT